MAKFPLSLALTLALALGATAQAHETFLAPAATTATGADVVLSSTEAYPRRDFGPKMERIAKTAVVGPDPKASLAATKSGDKAMSLALTAGTSGAYALAVELLPRDLDLAPHTVSAYFAEINASAAIRKAYRSQPKPRQWHETYTKYSKSFLCVGPCGDVASLEQPTGMQVEFRLAAARPGARVVEVILSRDGEPVAGLPVAMFDGKGRRTFLRTGQDGRLGIPPRVKGTILLSGVILEPVPGLSGTWRSAFATLTLTPEVRAAVLAQR